jgi:polyphosphate glucokinase
MIFLSTVTSPPDPTATTAILAIDIGGTHVKVKLSTGSEKRAVESGTAMTPIKMMDAVREMASGWTYDLVAMGYPGPVINHIPSADPHNLAPGWEGFDFPRAFGKKVRIVNDALMQAIGGYQGGRMLFLGLGTGLGSAMIADNVCLPLELAHLPYKKGKTFEEYVGVHALDEEGKHEWREVVTDVVGRLRAALQPDYVVLGGGNAHKLKELPPKCLLGDNENAFLGGFRIWQDGGLRI